VRGVGCGVWGVGCGVWGVGCGVWGVGCGVWGVGCELWALRWREAGDRIRVASPWKTCGVLRSKSHRTPQFPPLPKNNMSFWWFRAHTAGYKGIS